MAGIALESPRKKNGSMVRMLWHAETVLN